MRQPFAHEALLTMDRDADTAAPGAAVTVALCGHWEHEPPCPLSPHHIAAEWAEDNVRVRVLFAVEAQQESEVRQRIDRALSGGESAGPDGVATRWQLLSSAQSAVRSTETDHARRLTQS